MATFVTVTELKDVEQRIITMADDPEPSISGDTRYWHVGRNASHSFYLGLDAQGQLWSSAIGDGDEMTCECRWDAWCKCPRRSVDDIFVMNRRAVKPGEQLYVGR